MGEGVEGAEMRIGRFLDDGYAGGVSDRAACGRVHMILAARSAEDDRQEMHGTRQYRRLIRLESRLPFSTWVEHLTDIEGFEVLSMS